MLCLCCKKKTDEILALYANVGWKIYCDDKERLKQAFLNSLFVLGAYDKEELLGLIRVVGDGKTIIFIQDILVKKEYQNQGKGKSLITAILRRYIDVRQIQLTADCDEKLRAFYKDSGFKELNEYNCTGYMIVK